MPGTKTAYVNIGDEKLEGDEAEGNPGGNCDHKIRKKETRDF